MRKEIKMEPKVARASFFVSVAVKVGLQQFLRLKESKDGAGQDFVSFEPFVRFPELSLCLVLAFKSFPTSKPCLFSFSPAIPHQNELCQTSEKSLWAHKYLTQCRSEL